MYVRVLNGIVEMIHGCGYVLIFTLLLGVNIFTVVRFLVKFDFQSNSYYKNFLSFIGRD